MPPVANQRFSAEEPFAAATLRTLAGILVTMAALAGALMLLMLNPGAEPAVAEPAPSSSGLYLSALSGSLFRETQDGRQIRIEHGADLVPGDYYRCAADSRALLRSAVEELEIVLEPGCTLRVGARGETPRLELHVGAMRIRSEGNLSGRDLRLKAGTRSVVLSAPFSSYFDLDDDETLYIESYRGGATLIDESGETELEEGSVSSFGPGDREILSGAMLPAPEPQSPQPGAVMTDDTRVEFRWKENPLSRRYRLEISDDMLFSAIRHSQLVTSTSVEFRRLAVGKYYWRVTAQSREGRWSEASDARTMVIRTVEPAAGESTTAPTLQITSVIAQSSLVIVEGQTEPGAKVIIGLEKDGMHIIESEARLDNEGRFLHHQACGETGLITVVVRAFYREENAVVQTQTVDVDY